MSIKELLKEAVTNTDNTAITEALNNVFASTELSESVKTKFSTVFESVIKAKAIELAESHINACAEEAETIIASHKASLTEAAEEYAKFYEAEMATKLDAYLDHVVENWETENRLAVENGLKVEMFDGMVSGLKEMFVQHNIIVPTDAVDVVKELSEEIEELESKLNDAIVESTNQKRYIQTVDKEKAIARIAEGLTASQKEKVKTFAESLEYSTDFDEKLQTIVEFFTSSSKSNQLNEKEEDKKKGEEDKGSEKFKSDDEDDEESKEKLKESANPRMNQYLAASKKLRV